MNERAPALCVVLHDVAPANWEACRRVIHAIHDVASLPLTLLVVPRYHGFASDPGFEQQLSAHLSHGDELALHGYTHLDEMPVRTPTDWLKRRFYTDGEGEFAALPVEEALRRLSAGRQWFAERGWPLHGFVAPAWLLSVGSWQALLQSSFQYTATLRHLYPLSGERQCRLNCPSIVYSTRSAWRRIMSTAWNPLVFTVQEKRPLMRFELHPWDADHAPVRRNWQGLLAQALETRTPMTTAGFVKSWREDRTPAVAAPFPNPHPPGEEE